MNLLTKDRGAMIAGRSSPMINLTYEDRAELIIAAVTGAVLGFVGGYYLDHSRGFGLLVWTLVCAIIASGMVYCLRTIR